MTITARSSAKLPDRFDAFLYATVGGAEAGGASVVSMLARADHDPWQVAQQLAGMSRPLATLHLARLLAGPPAGALSPYAPPDLQTCVDRLPARASARKGSRLPLSMGAVFIAVNGLFFVLLCYSLTRPLPQRNVGSPRYAAEAFVSPNTGAGYHP